MKAAQEIAIETISKLYRKIGPHEQDSLIY